MYNSKYYTCEQIDQRLLEGYYDDAVAAGYTGSKAQYLAGLLRAINYSANPTIIADKVVYNPAISGLTSKNVQGAVDELQGSKINKTSISQESGDSEELVMSQKATSVELNKKANKTDIDVELGKKFDKESVVQELGDAENSVMSQKAITTAITDETTRAKAAEAAIVFDVSVYNNGSVFESLSALLSSPNLNTLIPTSFRHGGMTIRFIQGTEQSSDNKYVQYRLMTNTFSTIVADWQGVDDEPTAMSSNLVKSGGVYDKILNNSIFIGNPCSLNTLVVSGYYFITKGSKVSETPTENSDWSYLSIRVYKGSQYLIEGRGGGGPRIWCLTDLNRNVLSVAPASSSSEESHTVNVEEEGYLICNFSNIVTYNVACIKGGNIARIDTINGILNFEENTEYGFIIKDNDDRLYLGLKRNGYLYNPVLDNIIKGLSKNIKDLSKNIKDLYKNAQIIPDYTEGEGTNTIPYISDDGTAGFMSAFAKVNLRGGKIFVPEGQYNITQPIVFNSIGSINIEGECQSYQAEPGGVNESFRGTKLKNMSSNTSCLILGSNRSPRTRFNGSKISEIGFYGIYYSDNIVGSFNPSYPAYNAGIEMVYSPDQIRFERLCFKMPCGIVSDNDGTDSCIFDNLNFDGCDYGIFINFDSSSKYNRLLFADITGEAMRFNTAVYTIISQCQIQSVHGGTLAQQSILNEKIPSALYIGNGDNVKISNNIFKNTGGYSLYTYGISENQTCYDIKATFSISNIIGNTFKKGTYYAIHITGSGNVVSSNNISEHSYGISINGNQNAITGNIFAHYKDSAVSLEIKGNKNVASSNTLSGAVVVSGNNNKLSCCDATTIEISGDGNIVDCCSTNSVVVNSDATNTIIIGINPSRITDNGIGTIIINN